MMVVPRFARHNHSLVLDMHFKCRSAYYDHKEEIRKQIEDDECFALEMEKNTVSLVQQKLRNRHKR